MPSPEILRCVAVVRTDVSEKLSLPKSGRKNYRWAWNDVSSNKQLKHATIIVPSSLILVTLMAEAMSTSVTLVLTRTTRRNMPEEGILQHRYYFPMAAVSLVSNAATAIWWKPQHFRTRRSEFHKWYHDDVNDSVGPGLYFAAIHQKLPRFVAYKAIFSEKKKYCSKAVYLTGRLRVITSHEIVSVTKPYD
jgi:hypothetical protein